MPRFNFDLADAIAGAILIAVGLFFAVAGHNLSMGTASSMGSGYFPRAVSIFVMLVGAVLVARSFFSMRTVLDWNGLLPVFFITLSLVVFAATVERLGLLIAVTASILVARLPFLRGRPIESLALAVGMAAGTALLFPYLLGLPMDVLPP